ncbi:hypothetical protein C2R22_14730 [Salinigranum rubrum]|uniref:Glycosyltransferase RgtA/B/C/D-like domain-containing protein n=1 Tax=Salinigranum rubrum TaxID=755307 RepID=A0A2I8VLC7_9EURY|nr:hypothetical protein C2R22_14730 [Salinigranum rubrum]
MRSERVDETTTLTAGAERRVKLALTLGFVSLLGLVLTLRAAPANGFEVSIYGSTPLVFWILWFGVMALSFTLLLYVPTESTLWSYALLLAGVTAFTIPALPLLRGYEFYGLADALVHLGYTRSIAAGEFSPDALVYPASHLVAVFASKLGAAGVPHSMMRTELLFVVIYFLGIPLLIRKLVNDRRAVALAAFAAFLLMPVNLVSTYLSFHPFTMATLYFPVVLYAVFAHMKTEPQTGVGRFLSMTSLTLVLTGLCLISLHPQAALNALILFTVMAGLQFWARLRDWNHPLTEARTVYSEVILLNAGFLAWNLNHWRLFVAANNTVEAIVNTQQGEAQTGEVVANQTASLGDIGVSPAEIFLKMFSVEAMFIGLASLLVLRYLLRYRSGSETELPTTELAITTLTVGGITLIPFFVLQFLGAVSAYFFRHIGFGMVLITLFGALALYSLISVAQENGIGRYVRPVAVVAAVLVLGLSVVTLFGSPFIYKYTMHGDQQQMEGWTTSFEKQVPDGPDGGLSGEVWYGSTRTATIRYKQADQSKPGTSWYPGVVRPFPIPTGTVESEEMDDLVQHYQTADEQVVRRDHYFPVSTMTRERAVISYRELRYSEASFESLHHQPRVHRIQSNGGFTVYYVDLPDSEPTESEPVIGS